MAEKQIKVADHHVNPKILHRIYFEQFKPFRDPFGRYLESWHREMPGYKVMKWNGSNLDTDACDWVRIAMREKAPVYLSEYFRWSLLREYGGMYIDADCEILNGPLLQQILDELHNQDDYDVVFGVEERRYGIPTPQTVAARRGAELVDFMYDIFHNRLAPLWHWRESRSLIGPQIMTLWFLEHGINVKTEGYFKDLDEPLVVGRAKIYPQTYFSPKFGLVGDMLSYEPERTCIYHMFANLNAEYSPKTGTGSHAQLQREVMTFAEYRSYLAGEMGFPRSFDAGRMQSRIGEHLESDGEIRALEPSGTLAFGPYITLAQGRYTGMIELHDLPAGGQVWIKATARAGKTELGDGTFVSDGRQSQQFSIFFDVDEDTCPQVEVVTNIADLPGAVFKRLTIDRLAAPQAALPLTTPAAAESLPAKFRNSGLKVLHRIYFGFDGKPDGMARYLETWRSQLPDFEIREWNASNLPMDANDYVRRLYQEKDHAYLTDYFRWYVLREHGGVYLDADIEVLDGDKFRELVDALEHASDYHAFVGIDQREGGWYTAHSMAAKRYSRLPIFMCQVYDSMGALTIWRRKVFHFMAPQLTALYFADNGYNTSHLGTSPNLDDPIVAAGVKIYPQDFFGPMSPAGDKAVAFTIDGLSDRSCLCHHFACSWHDEDSTYRTYSKRHGGLSNALLAEVIAAAGEGRVFGKEAMRTEIGTKTADGIVVEGKSSGVLAYGPYVSLPAGRYDAVVHLDGLGAQSTAEIRVTSQMGSQVLATQHVAASKAPASRFRLTFTIERTLERNIEIHTRVMDAPGAIFRLVDIHPAQDDAEVERAVMTGSAKVFDAGSLRVGSAGQYQASRGISTTGQPGTLTFGPYLRIDPGRYRAVVSVDDLRRAKGFRVSVSHHAGEKDLPSTMHHAPPFLGLRPITQVLVDFDIPRPITDLEVSTFVEASDVVCVRSISIERQS